ncbi:hypothetical protein [Plasticicumulans sp.]|uniref:hypothetical protein n=1 Tax=Plasticicumulans sp. TaxID=2307179 RepID=UPI003220096B
MAIARTTFSLSDIAERWTRLYGEKWTESAVLQEAKAGRLMAGIELPTFQGIAGHPVDSIETQEQLDMLLIGAVKETGKDYVMPDKEQSTFAGFFWIRNYTALLGIELGESLRRVIEQERVLINHHYAVRPIIESVKDITTSPQNIIVRLQELEKFENEHGIRQPTTSNPQPAPPAIAANWHDALRIAFTVLSERYCRAPSLGEVLEYWEKDADDGRIVRRVDRREKSIICHECGKNRKVTFKSVQNELTKLRNPGKS